MSRGPSLTADGLPVDLVLAENESGPYEHTVIDRTAA